MPIQWEPLLNRPLLGPVKVSLLEGWPHFRGEFVLKSMLWDFSKWPEYRGGHISGVLIRGVPLYLVWMHGASKVCAALALASAILISEQATECAY